MQRSAATPALTWQHYALVFFVVYALWLLLVGTLDRTELVLGAFVAVILTLLFADRLAIFTGFRFSLLAPVYIVAYLADFFIALIQANLDMARRVLSPSLPINPAMVEIKTRLRSPLGKMLLANTITLTPGTLTVDVEDDRLLIHWVYRPPGMDSAEKVTRVIAERFEKRLMRFLI
jgi:multicomponent Na+:H+ antiporter subunit E